VPGYWCSRRQEHCGGVFGIAARSLYRRVRIARFHVEEFIRFQATDLEKLRHQHGSTVVLTETEALLDCPARAIHGDRHSQGAANV
jgi:hypothetical protein